MSGRLYRPRCELELDVPDWRSTADKIREVKIYPRVIDVKWTRNHHLAADEMTVSIGWYEGGVDPRNLKNGRVAMWMWDAAVSPKPHKENHLRFTGIVKSAERKLADSGWIVDLVCQDYTSMFINMKPFPSDAIPEWSDTLLTAWQKICDNTGYYDPDAVDPDTGKQGHIVSSVRDLRDAIDFIPENLKDFSLGEMVTDRFHEISKPAPKQGSDAWAVWQWCVCMSGLVTYIDRGRCVVTTTNEHYKEDTAPIFLYGHNIEDFEERADTDISNNGILLKSFNTLTGTLMESRYPLPSDDRIKKSRAQVKRAMKESRDTTLNEASGQYIEFELHSVQDQAALDRAARLVYEQYSRQEITGSFHTKEMVVFSPPPPEATSVEIDILNLMAGDCIYIGIHEDSLAYARGIESEEKRAEYLAETCGYTPQLALLCSRNIGVEGLRSPIYHVETIEAHLTPNSFDIEIKFHNKISLAAPNAAV